MKGYDGKTRHEAIVAFVREKMAEVLEVSPDAIGLDDSLFSLGLESQPAMRFVGEVERWLQVPVDPVLVFNHPTIRELAEQLGRLDPGAIEGSPRPPDGRSQG